jgi:hypothetical protein
VGNDEPFKVGRKPHAIVSSRSDVCLPHRALHRLRRYSQAIRKQSFMELAQKKGWCHWADQQLSQEVSIPD